MRDLTDCRRAFRKTLLVSSRKTSEQLGVYRDVTRVLAVGKKGRSYSVSALGTIRSTEQAEKVSIFSLKQDGTVLDEGKAQEDDMSTLHLFDTETQEQRTTATVVFKEARPGRRRGRLSSCVRRTRCRAAQRAKQRTSHSAASQTAPSVTEEQAAPAPQTDVAAPPAEPVLAAPSATSPAPKRAESPAIPAPANPSPRRTPSAPVPTAPASSPIVVAGANA